MNLNELTISKAAEGIRKKQFSVEELISDCLEAIRAKDADIRAYLDVFETAREDAKEKDQALANYTSGEMARLPPLYGIPLAIKDNILIEGKTCTAGSKILENYVAPYDATVISKLKKEGALLLGKTNLDEFAMGSSTENSAFGPTKNPHDTTRVPGGSSGGSAAAVAAHLALGALGSDTGGSIRQPAALSGVVGFKPTYGAVSRHGLIAMASSLDQIGPFAKTVEDAEILFSAVSGPDAFDATSAKDYRFVPQEKSLKGIKIGVPKEYFVAGLDADVGEQITKAVGQMEKAGAEIHEIELPHTSQALPTYYIVVPSEVSANLARFDGVRYGFHQDAATLFDTYAKTRKEGFGAEVKRRIMIGTYVLSAGYYDAYYVSAQKMRSLIREDFRRAFEKVDIIAGPTTPTPAFRFGEKTEDPVAMYLNDIYTVAANLAGVPAISLPAGFVAREESKLPVGLQLIGPWFEESKLFGIAKEIEKIIS